MKDLHKLLDALHKYLPSLPRVLGFSLIVKIEIAILALTCLYLYLFRIHPYFVLTSKSIQEQQAINREISTTLLHRYSEQVRELDSWWHSHVAGADAIPKLLDAINLPLGTNPISAIKVGDIVVKPDYRVVTITADFQGDYAAMLKWFQHIEQLPFFLEVDALSLSPHPNEALFKEGASSPPLFGQVKLLAILKK